MAEYIERKAAIKTAEHAYNEWNLAMAAADGKREINLVYKRQELCKAVASIFDSTPAADTVPVAHGRWIDKPTGRYGQMQSWCSACGKHSGIGGIKSNRHKPYCPYCGAKMKEDEIDG